MMRWIEAGAPGGNVEGLPRKISTSPTRRLYVQPIQFVLAATLDADDLMIDVQRHADETALLEERGGALVLIHREVGSDRFQFVSAFRSPTCTSIEELAAKEFFQPCSLAMAWVIDSPILFALAWDDHHRKALPINGLGRMTWRTLAEHVSRVRDAVSEPSVSRPPPQVAFG
jgi:hypothetical protein